MISKEIDRICDCLVSLVTTELEKDKIEEILDIISPLIRVFHEDNNDEQFSIQIARRLSSELCSFSKNYSICRHFVSINSEAILFNFIQTLLDANRIEIFPSCNLERIEGVAGEVAAQQALTLLDLFNDDFSHEPSEGENWRDSGVVAGIRIQQRRRNKAASVWGFCRNLGAAFSEVDHAEVGNRFNSSALSLGAVLLALDNDLSRRPGSSLNSLSLEKEVLECFQLLRNLVSAAAKSDVSNHFTFERVSAFSITVVITHILRTVRSLKYHDQTCAGSSQEKEKDFRRAGISELLSCFSELLVALSTWILRESGHSGSQSWSLFLGLLRDKLICPVLRKQHLDLTISLQQILLASTSVLTGTSQRSMSTVIGLPGCSKYLEEVFDSIIRRSGQLLIAASRSQDMSIQSSLAEAVIAADGQAEDQIAFCVGTSFQSSFFSSRRLSFRSPLQKGIDEYIRFVEKELPRDPELEVNMRKIKICFLSTFAVPRLNHKQTSLETKRRVLLLATHVLASNMHQAKRIDYSPMESGILCTLVKGISASLIQCLEKCVVDDSFVCALLSCSSNLANVSLTCEEGKNLSLISWSRNAVDLSNNKTLLDVTNNEINAAYSWVFFKWLQSLAASIVAFHEGGHDNQEKLQSVRKNFIGRECKDLEGDALSIDFEFSKLHQQRDFDDWDLLLRRLQKNVFPSKTENNPNIVNVYAKTRPANSKGSRSIEQWVPSPAAKRTAKEFMAEIIPLS